PADGPGGHSLDVLAAGAPLPPNPAMLIESGAMETVLEESRSTYDLVVIDAPPLGKFSDALALLPKVDGVIVVCHGNRNRRRASIQRLRASLDAAGAPLLGVIANFVSDSHAEAYADAPYQRLAAATEPVPAPSDLRSFAPNGPPRASRRRASVSRSSARFKRRTAGNRVQSGDDPHGAARH